MHISASESIFISAIDSSLPLSISREPSELMETCLKETEQNMCIELALIRSSQQTHHFFFHALKEGDIRTIQQLQAFDVDPAVKDVQGYTPVHLAVQNRNLSLLKLLLTAGFPINEKDEKGRTPLYYTLELSPECKALAELLIHYGGDPDQKDKDGYTPVCYARALNNHFLYNFFIKRVGRLKNVLDLSSKGFLTHAYHAGHAQAIQFLLTHPSLIKNDNETGHLLLASVKDGKVKLVKQLIKLGVKLNYVCEEGEIPLITAIQHQYWEIAYLLLEAGADPERCFQSGYTPLILASIYNQLELVKKILSHGAFLHHRTDNGEDALYLAVKNEHYEIADYLLEIGGDPSQYNCYKKNVFDLLVEKPTTPDSFRLKVFMHSSYKSIYNFSDKPLKDYFAKSCKKIPLNLEQRNFEGFTAFACATALEKNQYLSILSNLGADINGRIDKEKDTPLILAVKNRSYSTVKTLLQLGAKTDLQNSYGETALIIAMLNEFEDLAMLLIRYNADANTTSFLDHSALKIAVLNGRYSLLDYFLKHCKTLSNEEKSKALGYAIQLSFYKCASILIESEMDLNAVCFREDGSTPLHLACQKNSVKLVDHLIQKGADVNVFDYTGQTPLHVAIENGSDCLTSLLKAGADYELKDYWGNIPLSLSSTEGLPKAILVHAMTGNSSFLNLGIYTFTSALIEYLYLHYQESKDLQLLNTQLQTANELAITVSAIIKENPTHPIEKEAKIAFEELFKNMRSLNPEIISHPDYLKTVHKAVEFAWRIHPLVICFNFSPSPELALESYQKISHFYPLYPSIFDKAHSLDDVLLYHLFYRSRLAVSECYRLLENAFLYEDRQIDLALKVLIKNKIRRGKLETAILKHLIDQRPSLVNTILEALWETKQDAFDIKAKKKVFEYFKCASQPKDQIKLLQILSHYSFSCKNPWDIESMQELVVLSIQTTDSPLRRACALAFLQMNIPTGLIRAQEIIRSSDWDLWSSTPYSPEEDEVGPFSKWFAIPPLHLHRDRLLEIIYEKFALQHGADLRMQAESIYENYKIDSSSFPSISIFEKRLKNIPESARFVKPLICFPEQKTILRGFTQKGASLSQILSEVVTRGMGSADLNLLHDIEICHWARQGQTFFSYRWNYIKDSFWDYESILVGIDSTYLNQQILNGKGRIEKENHTLNAALYGSIPRTAIQHLFIPSTLSLTDEQKEAIEISERTGETKLGDKQNLKARITLVDPKIIFSKKTWVDTHNLALTTHREILKESLIHFIMRELIKGKDFTDFQTIHFSKFEKMSWKDFSAYLQAHVFNRYKLPFPKSFKANEVINPYTLSYAQPYTDQIPRWVHGPIHSARSTVWALLLIHLYNTECRRKIKDVYEILLAVSEHDDARKGEGKDEWDHESGTNVKHHFLKEGYPLSYAKLLGEGVSKKRKKETLYQKIIGGADCIDIMRLKRFASFLVIAPNRSSCNTFDTRELPIYKDLCALDKQQFADRLLQEIWYFIRLTEDVAIKIPLEIYSSNLIMNLFGYLKFMHEEVGCYPILSKIFKPYLEDSMLDFLPIDTLRSYGLEIYERVATEKGVW